MKKTLQCIGMAAICSLSFFSGCSGKQVKKTDEPVTLRIAWWGSQARHDATLAVLDLYTKKTGVRFDAEFLPFDGYFTKLNTLVASNDVYDVFQLGGNFPAYTAYLEPLNGYIKSGTIDTLAATESSLSTTSLNGIQYGISLGMNTYGIVYDPALFEKAGLKEPDSNWTWKEYENDCMTIKQKLGIFGCCQLEDFRAGSVMRIPQHDKNQMLFRQNGSGLDYADDMPIADYFSMRKRLVKAGAYPDPGRINEIKDIESDYLVTGKAAMTYCASNQFIALSGAAKRPLKLTVIPRESKDGPLGVAMQSSQMFGIYNGSKYKEEAAKFISFFVNDPDANRILKGERGVSIMQTVRDTLTPILSPEQKQVYDFVSEMSKLSDVPCVLDPVQQPEIKDLFLRIEDQMLFDKISPEDASKKFHTEAEAIFAKTK